MKRKRFRIPVCAALLVALEASLAAGNIASVSNVQILSGTPSPGASLTVQWDYSTADSFNDPRYVIVVGPTCAAQPANTAGQSILVGDGCAPSAQVTGAGCGSIPDNQSGPAVTHSATQVVTLPATLTPGSTYYLVVGMKSYNIYMNPGVSFDASACLAFSVPLPAPYVRLSKSAEGSSALPGGKVLYTLFYEFGNVTNVAITDLVDPGPSILQVYNGGSAVGQSITWNFPGYTGTPVQGFVSFLAQVGAAVPANTTLPNQGSITAQGGLAALSNNAPVTVGESASRWTRASIPEARSPRATP
jgi:hypothetical protein